jgi:hypothetical protein
MSEMLPEMKRLKALGFAIQWCHPKSKRPIGNDWASCPVKSAEELTKQYRPGMNMGCRLGKPSKTAVGYLAVIDCDVKSEDQRHRFEMDRKLRELRLTGDYPVTGSGRGNGSAHRWYVTDEPATTKRLAQSADKVKVLMPSVKPSGSDLKALSPADIKAGWRLRPAWEISVMGSGSHVVLPPSIHPDTGKAYQWVKSVTGARGNIPVLRLELPTEVAAPVKPDATWTLKHVDLAAAGVPAKVIKLIEDGTGCDDRSGGLFSAAIALVRFGLNDDEIATALTEPDTYLGAAAYDHCKSKDRNRAAKWVKRYTLTKARREYDEVPHFSPVTGNESATPKLPDKEAAAQVELVTGKNFRDQIDRGSKQEGAKPKNTLKNVLTILRGEFREELFKLDEFSGFIVYGAVTPWGATRGDGIKDAHVCQMKSWFANHYRFEPNTHLINEAILVLAQENAFHPVRDYLDTIEWDGTRRLDTWLRRLLAAEAPPDYLRVLSRKVVIAMIARIYEPGKKFDQVLILEGPQGVGKSRSIEALSGSEWYGDAPVNLLDKDGILAMRAKWIMEIGELSGMRRADADQLKEFISRKIDRVRVPYGRHMEEFPRQCIFVGSTNNTEYLKDATGNRRFWPVRVGDCDVEGLSRLLAW